MHGARLFWEVWSLGKFILSISYRYQLHFIGIVILYHSWIEASMDMELIMSIKSYLP